LGGFIVCVNISTSMGNL